MTEQLFESARSYAQQEIAGKQAQAAKEKAKSQVEKFMMRD